MRFLPISSATTALISYRRFSICAAERRRIFTRSCHLVAAHLGAAALAAANAACPSATPPFWNVPSSHSVLMGLRSSNFASLKRSAPLINIGTSLPISARNLATALSKSVCIFSGGLNMVAYVKRNLPFALPFGLATTFLAANLLAGAFTFLTSFLTVFFTAMLVPPVWGVGISYWLLVAGRWLLAVGDSSKK